VALLSAGLEIAAYFTYRHTVDGQAAVLNVILLFYALIAVAFVWAIDATVHRLRRRRQNLR